MLDCLRPGAACRSTTTVVLSGHGAQTTIGRERATNPFLRELLAAGSRATTVTDEECRETS